MTTYHVADLLKTDCLFIDPALRHRDPWRFGADEAREFFRAFTNTTFEIPDEVQGLFIVDGHQDWPRLSWAFGYLFRPDLAAIRAGAEPEVVASINFESGGHWRTPVIEVAPLRSPWRPPAGSTGPSPGR
ncbi:MAG: hypothetical protein Kow0059_13780 [Candidatus Sumerlaeia bacterium]